MLNQARSFTAVLFLSFTLLANIAFAQEGGQGFIASKNEGWMVDVNKAYEISKKTNKPILANFTGSDWCGWCIRLKKEVFSKPDFKEWAADNVVLLELDYPRKSKLPKFQAAQNAQLQQAFQVSGFPTIWMFDLRKPNGGKFEIQAYGKTGYAAGGSTNYIKNLENMIALKEKGIN